MVKYQKWMFAHFIIIISLNWRNFPLLRILQKQVNSECPKISSFSSTRRNISYCIIRIIWHKIVMQNFCAFHAFCKSALLFSLSKMYIVCYVLHAKFAFFVIIHVIFLNIPDNYDKILSIQYRSRFIQV